MRGNNAVALNLGLLLMRVALGGLLIFFAWRHLPVNGIAGLAPRHSLHAVGAAPEHGHWSVVGILELLAGTCLLLGLLARLNALAVLLALWVALCRAHGGPHYQTIAPPLFAFMALAAMTLLGGAGLVSADAWLFRKSLWAYGPQPLGEPPAAQIERAR